MQSNEESIMLGQLIRGVATAALAVALGGAAALAADKTITIGHFGNPTPMQLVAASDQLEQETGWTIDWRKFQAGTDVIAAMASGDIKLSELGSSPLAIAATQGVPIEMFMLSDVIGSAKSLIARDGTGIETLADLKGKRVAVPLASTAHFSLLGALENAGVDPSEVTILGMSPDQIAAAWAQDQIDAAFVWEPVQSKITENGKRIVSADEVEGKPTFDAWVVNTDFAAENPDFLVAFVKAMDEAFNQYNADPAAWTPESEPVQTIAGRTGANPQDIPVSLKGYVFPDISTQLSDEWLGGGIAGTLKDTAAFLKSQKKIPAALDDYSGFVDPQFLEAARQ